MLRPGQVIWLCALALLVLGVVMVNSAGMRVAGATPTTMQTILFSRSTVYMAMAVAAMTACSVLPVRRWLSTLAERHTADSTLSGWAMRPLWIGVAILLAVCALAYLPGLGRAVNGSHRWIGVNIPGLGEQRMQPSEIAKWGLVLLMAWYAAAMGPRLARFWTGLAPAIAAAGLVAGFVILEDLGTGALLALVGALILILAGARWWHFAMWLPVAGAGLAAAILTSEYRMRRIQTWLDPYLDPQGAGYHVIQSMTAIANGEVFGRGLGHGLQKFGYLPEDQTDFIFAVICEELGLLGAAGVLFLYLLMIWAGYAIVRRTQQTMLKLIAFGVVATLGIQAMVNLAVVTAIGPTKGIALPLLSSGGTGWILTAACLGLLIALDREAADDAAPMPMPLPA